MKITTGVVAVTSLAMEAAYAAPPVDVAKKQPSCESLKGKPSEDIRWNFETATQAKCHATTWGAMQHWEITIPNDHIFSEKERAKSGERGCGKAVHNQIPFWGCAPGFWSCTTGEDNTARAQFTCAIFSKPKTITKAFHKGTCHAFPEIECYKT